MKKYTLALMFLSTASFSYAEEQKVQHGAHEHGVAEMNIVWEKQDLNIELRTPAFNITGFEHQPNNHEQEETIEKIEKQLNLPDELFAFTGASCKSVKSTIESPFEAHADEKHEAKDEHQHEEHADEKHDAKEDHEHEEHAKHDDHEGKKDHDEKHEHDEHEEHEKHAEHDHDEHESSTHSEYHINYAFTCADSKSELSVVTANLFKQFPQMEKIKVQWLSATQQSSSVLSKKNNSIKLK